MRRGDIVIVSGRGFAGKPQPAVIVQSEAARIETSLTVLPMTSEDLGAHLLRPAIEPDAVNNLRVPSWVMVDKIMTVEVGKIGRRIGALTAEQMPMLDGRLGLFLGLLPA